MTERPHVRDYQSSAITSRTAVAPAPGVGQGDQRIVIQGVDWDLYDRLSEAIGTSRLAFRLVCL